MLSFGFKPKGLGANGSKESWWLPQALELCTYLSKWVVFTPCKI